MAATITYIVNTGEFPITVFLISGATLSFSGVTIATNTHLVPGTYSFTNVPSGDYTLTFVDSWYCTESIPICDLTAEISNIVYNCEFDFTLDLIAFNSSPTPTPTITPTPSPTPSLTITPTPSRTSSRTPSRTSSVGAAITPSITITKTPSRSPSITPTVTPTLSITQTPTPSVSCARPLGLIDYELYYGYNNPFLVNFTATLNDACLAMTFIGGGRTFYGFTGQAAHLTFLEKVYDGLSTSCQLVPTGYYIFNISTTPAIVYIVDGIIVSFPVCPSATPSMTPTITPSHIIGSPSITPTITPTVTKTPSLSISKTPSLSISKTPSLSISKTPSLSISKTPSLSPSQSCARPIGLTIYNFYFSYGNPVIIDFTGSLNDACTALASWGSTSFYALPGMAASIAIGQIVYDGTGTNCALKPTGYYIVVMSGTPVVVYVVNGFIIAFYMCASPSITPSLTPSRTPVPSCARQHPLNNWRVYSSYGPVFGDVDFTDTLEHACAALCLWPWGFWGVYGSSLTLALGTRLYVGASPGITSCESFPTGYYIVETTPWVSTPPTSYGPAVVIYIVDGIITSHDPCPICPSRSPSVTPSITVTPSPSRCNLPEVVETRKIYYSDDANIDFSGDLMDALIAIENFDANTFHYLEGKTIPGSLTCDDPVWINCDLFPDGFFIVPNWGTPYIFHIVDGFVQAWYVEYFIDNGICWCCDACATICGTQHVNTNTGYHLFTFQPYNISTDLYGATSTMEYMIASGILSNYTINATGTISSGPLDPGDMSTPQVSYYFSNFPNLLFMRKVGETTWHLVKNI
jgi:hypothetical protein